MRRSTTIVGALAGLGALVSALVLLERREVGGGLGPAPQAIQAPPSAEPPRLALPTEAEPGSTDRQAEPLLPQPHPNALATDPPAVTVLVRSEETGMPLTAHLVHWAPYRRLGGSPFLKIFSANPEGLPSDELEDHELLTDREGLVRIPLQERGMLVWTAAPEGYGALTIGPKERTDRFELVVRSNDPLVVRTVDPDGVPVGGVRLVLQVFEDAVFNLPRDLGEATSDAEGRTHLENARALAELSRTGVLFVRVQHSPAHALALEARAWPIGEVALALPGSGALQICVASSGSSGDFQVESKKTHVQARVLARVRPDSEDGCADLTGLPLGRTFEISWQGQRRSVEGPRTPGEVVRVDLAVEQREMVVLTGRLISADHTSLGRARVRFEARTWADGAELRSNSLNYSSTDDEGTFEISISVSAQASQGRLFIYAEHGHAEIDFRLPLQPGANDLGAVALRPENVLATIHVRDEEGRPVERAQVKARYRQGRVELNVRSTVPGRSEVLGPVEQDKILLHIEADAFLVHESTCAPAGETLEVVLARSYSLAGRVLLDPDVDPGLLAVWVVGAAGRGDVARPRRGDGGFGFGRLESPAASIEIFLLNETDAVVVHPLAPGDKPAIDLRGRIHAYLIQVRDRGGVLVEGQFRRTDPLVSAEVGYRDFSGVISLAASTPTIDLSVESPSGVLQDFQGVRSGDVLVLD